MTEHVKDQELLALSIHQLNALEAKFRERLDQVDPHSPEAERIRGLIDRIVRIRSIKLSCRPSP